jgi:hypothetical protein
MWPGSVTRERRAALAVRGGTRTLINSLQPCPATLACFQGNTEVSRDCSRAAGFIQPAHDEVMQGFVAGLRRGLPATYPAHDAHGSALASALGRHSCASDDRAGCPAPPHARWRAGACRQDTCGPCPPWGQRVAGGSHPTVGTAGADPAVWPVWPERSGSDSAARRTPTPVP